jgi:uncharacterized protein (TIGR02001 family)
MDSSTQDHIHLLGTFAVRFAVGAPQNGARRSAARLPGNFKCLLLKQKIFGMLYAESGCGLLQFCSIEKGSTMIKKALTAGFIVAALASGLAQAQGSASPHTITGNVGLYSQYIFRGLTQTDRDPAIQGGFDYSHSSGFYLGTWASNISWLRDFGAYTAGGSAEIDFYGGFRNTFGKSDFGYDVGLLYYWYPGTTAPGAVDADTLEVYGALSWKWLSAKLSYALSDDVFGVQNADGTYYLDFTASYPVPNSKLSLVAHYGIQKFTGSTGTFDNDTNASYEDWKLGVSYALPKDFTIGAFYTDTSMDATQQAFYTTPTGRFLGKDTFTVYISKTF